jgi:hypothetical protein
MNTVENISTRTPLAQSIIAALMTRNEQAGIVQSAFVDLIEVLATTSAPKVAVVTNTTLRQVFEANLRGEDSKRIAAWLGGFTPIKVVFSQETGRFDKIAWSAARVKNCKADDVPLFDVAGMKAVLWTEFDPTSGRAKSAPEIERALKALFRDLARGIDAGVFPAGDARKLIETAVHEFDERIDSAREEKNHEKWVEDFTTERAAAKRREESRKGGKGNVVQMKAA